MRHSFTSILTGRFMINNGSLSNYAEIFKETFNDIDKSNLDQRQKNIVKLAHNIRHFPPSFPTFNLLIIDIMYTEHKPLQQTKHGIVINPNDIRIDAITIDYVILDDTFQPINNKGWNTRLMIQKSDVFNYNADPIDLRIINEFVLILNNMHNDYPLDSEPIFMVGYQLFYRVLPILQAKILLYDIDEKIKKNEHLERKANARRTVRYRPNIIRTIQYKPIGPFNLDSLIEVETASIKQLMNDANLRSEYHLFHEHIVLMSLYGNIVTLSEQLGTLERRVARPFFLNMYIQPLDLINMVSFALGKTQYSFEIEQVEASFAPFNRGKPELLDEHSLELYTKYSIIRKERIRNEQGVAVTRKVIDSTISIVYNIAKRFLPSFFQKMLFLQIPFNKINDTDVRNLEIYFVNKIIDRLYTDKGKEINYLEEDIAYRLFGNETRATIIAYNDDDDQYINTFFKDITALLAANEGILIDEIKQMNKEELSVLEKRFLSNMSQVLNIDEYIARHLEAHKIEEPYSKGLNDINIFGQSIDKTDLYYANLNYTMDLFMGQERATKFKRHIYLTILKYLSGQQASIPGGITGASTGIYDNVIHVDFRSHYLVIMTILRRYYPPDSINYIISQELENLLMERERTKQQMKKYREGSAEHIVLNSKQLALKLIGNSIYGMRARNFQGANFIDINFAFMVTTLARNLLNMSLAFILKHTSGMVIPIQTDTDGYYLAPIEGKYIEKETFTQMIEEAVQLFNIEIRSFFNIETKEGDPYGASNITREKYSTEHIELEKEEIIDRFYLPRTLKLKTYAYVSRLKNTLYEQVVIKGSLINKSMTCNAQMIMYKEFFRLMKNYDIDIHTRSPRKEIIKRAIEFITDRMRNGYYSLDVNDYILVKTFKTKGSITIKVLELFEDFTDDIILQNGLFVPQRIEYVIAKSDNMYGYKAARLQYQGIKIGIQDIYLDYYADDSIEKLSKWMLEDDPDYNLESAYSMPSVRDKSKGIIGLEHIIRQMSDIRLNMKIGEMSIEELNDYKLEIMKEMTNNFNGQDSTVESIYRFINKEGKGFYQILAEINNDIARIQSSESKKRHREEEFIDMPIKKRRTIEDITFTDIQEYIMNTYSENEINEMY